MKNSISFLGSLIVVLVLYSLISCYSESIKPKTVKHTDFKNPANNITFDYNYNGNKIVSIISKQRRIYFTYQGNVIVKTIDSTIVDKDVTVNEFSYKYADGKVRSCDIVKKEFGEEFKQRKRYAYKGNNTIIIDFYNRNSKTDVQDKNSFSLILTIEKGNLIKQELSAGKVTSSLQDSEVTIFEYDKKNNPFKNVLDFTMKPESNAVNNCTKSIFTKASDELGSKTTTSIIKYEYNSDAYPIKEIHYAQDGTTSETIEYTY